MQSLILMSYKQPHKETASFRWGVVCHKRDTKKNPLDLKTLQGPYRKRDPLFKRSRNLWTVLTRSGPKAFYHERTRWSLRIPFVGSLVKPFLPTK